jgi:hypothetical protein
MLNERTQSSVRSERFPGDFNVRPTVPLRKEYTSENQTRGSKYHCMVSSHLKNTGFTWNIVKRNAVPGQSHQGKEFQVMEEGGP